MLDFIFQEGLEDFYSGFTLDENPYGWATEEYDSWEAGWLHGFRLGGNTI